MDVIMRAGYTEADFARAVEIVGREGSLAVVVEGLGIEWDYLTEIGDVFVGKVPGRTAHDQITLYESHGMGIQDLYAAAKALEVIARNARAQAELVEDLLDVSRVHAGKLRLQARPVNLVEPVEHAQDALHSPMPRRPRRFSSPSTMPTAIATNASRRSALPIMPPFVDRSDGASTIRL